MRSIPSLLLTLLLAAQSGVQTEAAPTGESLYRKGLLPSGGVVTASREGTAGLAGADAACINCHRRSGLGEIEGSIKIPPISGPYLFHARATARDDLDVPYVDNMRVDREPYTAAALSRAIRDGIGVDGKPLNYLMPRYSLSEADMAALIDYLQGMQPLKTRGVSGAVVNFATIVTPDTDLVRQQGVQRVLVQYFADQNAYAMAQTPKRLRSESMESNSKRRWQLHVWTLSGTPATWRDQLDQHLAREPVYAVISGVGGADWRPVHDFCEHAELPCIFPNLDLPVVAEPDNYSLYFSKGVLLEAELLAKQISNDNKSNPLGRVVQVFRADDVGAQASAELKRLMAGSGVASLDFPLRPSDTHRLNDLLRSVKPGDVLVLWLRAADIALLANRPMRASGVYASGLMGGLENMPLPAAWRTFTHLTYPAALPDKRLIGAEFALGWMKHHRIPVLDAQVQVNTYTACGVLMETLTRMSGSFTSDYLVERIEGMLEHQLVSGYYPSLAMAPGEHFASKGGYIVHFGGPIGTGLLADTDWRIP